MVSWFVARHIFYLMTCYSIYKDLPEQITWGCYHGPNSNLTGPLPIPDGWGHVLEPFNGSEGTVCFSSSIQWGFLNCLLGLQVLTIFWFFMIINVAIRVVKGDGADDTRSDDERDENELETEYEEAQPLEEEVGVEAIDLKGGSVGQALKEAQVLLVSVYPAIAIVRSCSVASAARSRLTDISAKQGVSRGTNMVNGRSLCLWRPLGISCAPLRSATLRRAGWLRAQKLSVAVFILSCSYGVDLGAVPCALLYCTEDSGRTICSISAYIETEFNTYTL